MSFERWRGEFVITTDQRRFDIDVIHDYLTSHAYWSAGIPKSVVRRAIDNSLCFGLLEGTRQAGFTRAVTDRATFAWICDVFVLEEYRGRGLGSWLVASALEHPDMQGLRRIVLATRDAHELYRRAGFGPLPSPDRWMAIADPDVYTRRSVDA